MSPAAGTRAQSAGRRRRTPSLESSQSEASRCCPERDDVRSWTALYVCSVHVPVHEPAGIVDGTDEAAGQTRCPRQDSNLRHLFRRPVVRVVPGFLSTLQSPTRCLQALRAALGDCGSFHEPFHALSASWRRLGGTDGRAGRAVGRRWRSRRRRDALRGPPTPTPPLATCDFAAAWLASGRSICLVGRQFASRPVLRPDTAKRDGLPGRTRPAMRGGCVRLVRSSLPSSSRSSPRFFPR